MSQETDTNANIGQRQKQISELEKDQAPTGREKKAPRAGGTSGGEGFEYLVKPIPALTNAITLEALLTSVGREGWGLVEIAQVENVKYAVFERGTG